jgi:UPF0271 protein
MSPRAIDLNCDLGEDPAARDLDEALLRVVTSANVATGGHAGDGESMRTLARLCLEHGVALGAHPAYPDREGFGRRPLDLEPSAIEHLVFEQVHALVEAARAEGATLTHVKAHGALYHAAHRRGEVALALARAVLALDPTLVLVAPVASPALTLWRSMGLTAAAEAFADRRYDADGRLAPRTEPDALLLDPAEAAEQAALLARGALRPDGSPLPTGADTLCIHGDTPGALGIAQAVRARLAHEHVTVRPLR